MAEYKRDKEDIFFNLFDFLNLDKNSNYTKSELMEIINQFDNFVKNEIYPTRQLSDQQGVKLTSEGVKVPEFLHKAKRAFYENGWFALGLPEEFEGMPVPSPVAIACDSLYVGANVGFSMYSDLTRGVLNVIYKTGSKEQKNSIIPKMMSGDWGGTMCLTEPGAGSDVGAVSTTAKPIKNSSNRYSIKGVKIFISSGESDLYQNNIHLVLARTPGAPEGTKGLSLFIVARYNADNSSNNVYCTKVEEKMGIHASSTCELTFGEKGECIGEMIGDQFDGMKNMFIMMNDARILCGTQGESQANLVYQLTKQYVNERTQFGIKIADHPDVAKTIKKMRARGRGLRALLLNASQYLGENADKNDQDLLALYTPICKAYCTDVGFEVAVDAIQMHGGYGFCSEYGIEQFARDLKIATIYEGTNGIQAADYVMRKILGDKGKSLSALIEKIDKDVKSFNENFALEAKELNLSLEYSQEILKFIMTSAQKKDFNSLLYYSTEILRFHANLITSWLLGLHAMLAKEKLSSNNDSNNNFYSQKIEDFEIFCQFYLVQNRSLFASIIKTDLA